MFIRTSDRFLFNKAGEGEGAGGSGGSSGAGSGGTGSTDYAKDIADLKAQNAALLERLDKLTKSAGGGSGGGDPDPDLREKARRDREAEDKKTGDTKALEAALRFSLESEKFLKQNAGLLPKDVADIFKTAEKENYGSAIEKDAAIKSGIIQSFFSVQANLDLLTPGLKNQLEDYLKLTKTGKQEKAQSVYDTIFEPAFEMLRRVKKAEALNKGYGSSTDSEDAYKKKMMDLSKKHYLGEKA